MSDWPGDWQNFHYGILQIFLSIDDKVLYQRRHSCIDTPTTESEISKRRLGRMREDG